MIFVDPNTYRNIVQKEMTKLDEEISRILILDLEDILKGFSKKIINQSQKDFRVHWKQQFRFLKQERRIGV